MILSKVAAEREPPCIEVDNSHEQERNVPRVVNIESIFAVITPKLHEKVGQKAKRTWNFERSGKKKRQHVHPHLKGFSISRREEETSTIASVLVRGTSHLFFKMVPGDVTECSKSDGIIST